MWYTRNIYIFFINWTLHMSDNLPERFQILGHTHILCITVRDNRIICGQIFCDLLLKSAFERIFNIMQLSTLSYWCTQQHTVGFTWNNWTSYLPNTGPGTMNILCVCACVCVCVQIQLPFDNDHDGPLNIWMYIYHGADCLVHIYNLQLSNWLKNVDSLRYVYIEASINGCYY
jgi:hypothetical protein